MVTLARHATPGLRRAVLFRVRMRSSFSAEVGCSVIVDPPSGMGRGLRPCRSGEERDGEGTENLPLARASCVAWSPPTGRRITGLGRLHGRSIVVRERKGGALRVPLGGSASRNEVAPACTCAVRRARVDRPRPRDENPLTRIESASPRAISASVAQWTCFALLRGGMVA